VRGGSRAGGDSGPSNKESMPTRGGTARRLRSSRGSLSLSWQRNPAECPGSITLVSHKTDSGIPNHLIRASSRQDWPKKDLHYPRRARTTPTKTATTTTTATTTATSTTTTISHTCSQQSPLVTPKSPQSHPQGTPKHNEKQTKTCWLKLLVAFAALCGHACATGAANSARDVLFAEQRS